MIIGSTLIHDGTGLTPFYTPSFDRGGGGATFAVDVTHLAGTPTLVVTVEGKNYDETSWITLGTFANITSVGVADKDVTGLKEQLRLAFTFSAGNVGDFVQVVMAAPAWRQYA